MEIINVNSPIQKEKFPFAKESLTYSIWGNCLCLLFFVPFLGVVATIVSLVLAIRGLKKGKIGVDMYKGNSLKYEGGSFAMTLIGFILGIIGTITSGILIIYSLFFTILMSAVIFGGHF